MIARAIVLFGGMEECTMMPSGLRHGESGREERSWVNLLLYRHGERACYTRRGDEYETVKNGEEEEEGGGCCCCNPVILSTLHGLALRLVTGVVILRYECCCPNALILFLLFLQQLILLL